MLWRWNSCYVCKKTLCSQVHCRNSPGTCTEERACASFGPAAVGIPCGDAVSVKQQRKEWMIPLRRLTVYSLIPLDFIQVWSTWFSAHIRCVTCVSTPHWAAPMAHGHRHRARAGAWPWPVITETQSYPRDESYKQLLEFFLKRQMDKWCHCSC